jgi:16S rRNA (cytosine967-C5)-methyltransferase
MDVDQSRLDKGALRVKRAGANFIERRAAKDIAADEDLHAAFERVLVDAPCSGSGAWRRHPDARWRLTPEKLEDYKTAQRDVLRKASQLVKPGGRLVYVTCSLLPEENGEQVARFLEEMPAFAPLPAAGVWRDVLEADYPGDPAAPFLTLTPARHGTDGFFVAILERRREAA